MAFDPKPSTWFPNWSEDATNITVPLATFPGLTAAEADATTGDIRDVMFAILAKLYSAWAATATADRPTMMTMTKSVSTNVDTDVNTTTYTIRFYSEVSAEDVKDEPA